MQSAAFLSHHSLFEEFRSMSRKIEEIRAYLQDIVETGAVNYEQINV